MDGFKTFPTLSDLAVEDQELINEAKLASENSYSPYSNFMVGSALKLEDGKIIHGSNQENASYPAGLCAERVALFHAASNHPDSKVESIAVVAKRANESDFRPVSPCGICRQVMLEQEIKQKSPIRIIMQATDGQWIVSESAQNLLPYSFAQNSL